MDAVDAKNGDDDGILPKYSESDQRISFAELKLLMSDCGQVNISVQIPGVSEEYVCILVFYSNFLSISNLNYI